MLYILFFILTVAPDNFLHITIASEEENLSLHLPVSLINYLEMFSVTAEDIDQTMREENLKEGDTLTDIDTGEEKLVIVLLSKDDVLERGNVTPKNFRIEVEDEKEGKSSIILPLWSFRVFSKFGGSILGDIDTVFVDALSKSLKDMGGGRYKFLEASDGKSSVRIFLE